MPVGVSSQWNRIWNMEWNDASYYPNWYSYAKNDEIVTTYGCSYTIVEFGQVATHLIYRLSYCCVTTATLMVEINGNGRS